MRFRLIEAEKAEHSISRLCSVLGVTRQGFYAWRRRGPSLRQLGDDELKRLIVTIYDGSLQTYGAPRVQLDLAEDHDVHVGRKRVARLMRDLGLQGVSRRGKRVRTTVADEKAPPAPDLVERRFVAERPNALWLADITYVPTLEGYLFLGVVMDMFSRKIVGCRCGTTSGPNWSSTRSRWRSPAGDRRPGSSTTPTEDRSTPRSPSGVRSGSRSSSPRWAPAAMPTTTPPANR